MKFMKRRRMKKYAFGKNVRIKSVKNGNRLEIKVTRGVDKPSFEISLEPVSLGSGYSCMRGWI